VGQGLFYRSYAEHVCEGMAPDRMRTEIVAVRKDASAPSEDVNEEAISPAEFQGEVLPRYEYATKIVQAMVERWEKTNKPKLFIRVPTILTMDDSTLEWHSHHYDLIAMIV